MRKIALFTSMCIVIAGLFSCEDKPIEVNFEDQEKMTIYDYMKANEENFSSFLQILSKGHIDKALTAYNPNGANYTLFLPTNEAINKFIEESEQYNSLEDLLNDSVYVYALSRYHIVNMGIDANDFPFGALPEYTLSGDLLTVSFVIEEDTSYYKINNQSPISRTNIELSNGFIHIISEMLRPVVYTTYQWLEQNSQYSIFKDAIDAAELQYMFNIDLKDELNTALPFTLLVEPDSVYHKRGIYSFSELASILSPENNDYSSPDNPVYNFIRYHLLDGSLFLDEFVGKATNYTTYSEIPLLINGAGLDIKVNPGKEIFDTLIVNGDTTIIDFIGFLYDASNVLTKSGSIHFIDQIMYQQSPSKAIQTFEFYGEPLLDKYRLEAAEYLIEDTSLLNNISWSGTDLIFVELGDQQSSAWGADYLQLDGDFSITYTIPKLVQGRYSVFLGAEAYNAKNAVVEVFIDGIKIGGLIDLTTGGSSAYPFSRIELGELEFLSYQTHKVEVRSLIPGRFLWDYIRFEPLK